jgi:hypothetical protein
MAKSLFKPFFDSTGPASIPSARASAVLETGRFGPRISPRIDLAPFVEELGRKKSGAQTTKGLFDLRHGSATKIKDKNRWTMNEREPPVVQKISVAC